MYSSPSPPVFFPRCCILCVFLLYRKAWTHLPLLFKSTWAGHLHVSATCLLVEDWLQEWVVIGFITDEAGVLVGLLLRLRLITSGLRGCWCGVFWPLGLLCKRVKVCVKSVGWTYVLGASALPLWQECLPPWGPFSHLWAGGGSWKKVKMSSVFSCSCNVVLQYYCINRSNFICEVILSAV